jgi:hypothetical protein
MLSGNLKIMRHRRKDADHDDAARALSTLDPQLEATASGKERPESKVELGAAAQHTRIQLSAAAASGISGPGG